jgi:integrase
MGNLPKRTIILRRLKGSDDSTHYLERDELAGPKALRRSYAANGIKSVYVFVNERGQPFARMGIARIIERGGEVANLPFPIHVHMLRHSTGYALAARGMDTRRLQHFLGHASNTNTVRYTAHYHPCRRERSWRCIILDTARGRPCDVRTGRKRRTRRHAVGKRCLGGYP